MCIKNEPKCDRSTCGWTTGQVMGGRETERERELEKEDEGESTEICKPVGTNKADLF